MHCISTITHFYFYIWSRTCHYGINNLHLISLLLSLLKQGFTPNAFHYFCFIPMAEAGH